MLDALIVGSGPAGTFTAFGLQGKQVGILDVGNEPEPLPAPTAGVDREPEEVDDRFDLLIGDDFEGLCNVAGRDLSLKLKAPGMGYIVRDAEALFPVREENFSATVSYAKGGLANAWGAGLYRFTDTDLRDFPFSAADLDPFYDRLTEHIGISGENDDLTPFFGHDSNLQPPLPQSTLSSSLLERYASRRKRLNGEGLYMGRPRLGVLSRPHRGRDAYQNDGSEFFRPHNSAIFNPAYTLEELRGDPGVTYLQQRFVESFEESEDRVTVRARNLTSGATETLQARHLFLAAGALNTAKLVLKSVGNPSTRLPILDNPMSCLPAFDWRSIGGPDPATLTSMAQLNLVFPDDDSGELLQGSVYGGGAPLRSDILFRLPLTATGNRECLRLMSPATILVMLFRGGRASSENFIRLPDSGELEIRCERQLGGAPETRLIRWLRRLGFLTTRSLCQYPELGTSLHYAGCLPMRARPGPMQTDPHARLFGSKRVHVSDAASFSSLPAKNLSFTIMAHAMRIASHVRENHL